MKKTTNTKQKKEEIEREVRVAKRRFQVSVASRRLAGDVSLKGRVFGSHEQDNLFRSHTRERRTSEGKHFFSIVRRRILPLSSTVRPFVCHVFSLC
jgi:hypothetical protein